MPNLSRSWSSRRGKPQKQQRKPFITTSPCKDSVFELPGRHGPRVERLPTQAQAVAVSPWVVVLGVVSLLLVVVAVVPVVVVVVVP